MKTAAEKRANAAYRERNRQLLNDKEKARYAANKEPFKTRHKTYYEANKQKIIARNRVNFIKAKYNLTPEQVQKMYDDQKGLCAMCFKPLGRSPAIDHNHQTGKARGLLHQNCNAAIGLLGDDLVCVKQALAYLEKHQ